MDRKSNQVLPQVTLYRLIEALFGLTLAREITFYDALITKEERTRGRKSAAVYLKDLYTQGTKIALGLSPDPIPFRKSDLTGMAKDLRPFAKLLKSDDPNRKRAALTILRSCYLLYTEPSFSIDSIIREGRLEQVKAITVSFTAFASKRVPPADPGGAIEMIPRARAGPNGPSSIMGGHLDAVALAQRPELLQALQDLASMIDPSLKYIPEKEPKVCVNIDQIDPTGLKPFEESDRSNNLSSDQTNTNPGHSLRRTSLRNKYHPDMPKSLIEWVKYLAQWSADHHVTKQDRYPVSRLAFLSEGGAKTRVIAIGDLFSQAVYLPLHNKIMKRLRSLSQDATHEQGKAISWLKEKTALGPVWSFDLTSATDRFPISLQRIVLSFMFGVRVASLWESSMSLLRDFSFKDSKGRLTTDVYYRVGQPMGLYSSWPSFAYTHHIFVQWCASLEGIEPFEDYVIIGDDVVIANESVAQRYRLTLLDIGVPISEAKSIIKTTPPYAGEVAKRLVVGGKDVSPIPPDLIKLVDRHVTMLPALIDEIESRYGLSQQSLSALASLKSIYRCTYDQEKAAILLSAPAAFAAGGIVPFYGKSASSVTPISMESAGPKDLSLGPWSSVDPEVLPDIGWIKEQTRKVFLLREYEKVYKEWNFFHPSPNGEVKPIYVPGTAPDNERVMIDTLHPLYVASTWLECELHALFATRVSILGNEEEYSMEDIGIRYCLDPTMRSYRDRRSQQANISSHLTLEVYKVLTGQATMPEIEHPADGLLVAWVAFTS